MPLSSTERGRIWRRRNPEKVAARYERDRAQRKAAKAAKTQKKLEQLEKFKQMRMKK